MYTQRNSAGREMREQRRFNKVKRSPKTHLFNCNLTSTLVAPSFALKANTAFSKTTLDVLEVIGDLVMLPFSLHWLASLSQVKRSGVW